MTGNENGSLPSFSNSPLSSEAATIEGIINYISWHRRPPYLYFHDQKGTCSELPLTHLVGEQVEIILGEIEICTSCGEPASSSPCGKCGMEPPFADCIKQPARDCTYQSCPYNSFKTRNCSEPFGIYLGVSDRVKIGISRINRLSTRWREQGLTHAIRIATAPNRYEAGLIEASLDAAREELAAILQTKVLSQGSQVWSTPLSSPRETLVDAAVMAGDYFPPNTQSWYRFPDRDRDRIQEAIKPIPALSTGLPDDGFPHRLLTSIGHISEGETITSQFVGVRGQLLVTERGFINCNTHSGHHIQIRTTAPYTEYLTDTEQVPSAASPEIDQRAMFSSNLPNSEGEGESKNAAEFM